MKHITKRAAAFFMALAIAAACIFTVTAEVEAASNTTKLKKMAEFYIKNVKTCSSSKQVYCKLVKTNVRADASGFATAYMSYLSGKKVEQAGTSTLVKNDKSIAKKGFKYYTTDKTKGIDKLKAGDILVANDGVYSFTKGKVCLVYIDKKTCFGWNNVYKKYPVKTKKFKNVKSGKHTLVTDGTHKFYGVWRYTGK